MHANLRLDFIQKATRSNRNFCLVDCFGSAVGQDVEHGKITVGYMKYEYGRKVCEGGNIVRVYSMENLKVLMAEALLKES